jgi:hypothetical protein
MNSSVEKMFFLMLMHVSCHGKTFFCVASQRKVGLLLKTGKEEFFAQQEVQFLYLML